MKPNDRHCEEVQELDECISSITADLSLVTLPSLLWHAVTVGWSMRAAVKWWHVPGVLVGLASALAPSVSPG
jgi:hypothetical protein